MDPNAIAYTLGDIARCKARLAHAEEWAARHREAGEDSEADHYEYMARMERSELADLNSRFRRHN
jgi:hypothetical protein